MHHVLISGFFIHFLACCQDYTVHFAFNPHARTRSNRSFSNKIETTASPGWQIHRGLKERKVSDAIVNLHAAGCTSSVTPLTWPSSVCIVWSYTASGCMDIDVSPGWEQTLHHLGHSIDAADDAPGDVGPTADIISMLKIRFSPFISS